jgi:ferredoxin-type protein NapH
LTKKPGRSIPGHRQLSIVNGSRKLVVMSEKTKFAGFFSRLQPYRLWVQSAFLLVWLDPLGVRYHRFCAPVFHCYACPLATFACPIGVLANFSALHLIPFITIGFLIVVGALFGSLFCGWACPFGLLQDLGSRIPTYKFELPRWTGHFRFVVLGLMVVAIPYLFGEEHPLFICRVCPAGGLEAAVPNMVSQAVAHQPIVWPSTLKLTIIGVFIGSILFLRRPWCRVLCPLGAIFSAFNRVSAFFLRFEAGKCTDCQRCGTLCQYNIEPQKSPNDLRCIRCLECTRCDLDALTPGTIFHRQRKVAAGAAAPAGEPKPPA